MAFRFLLGFVFMVFFAPSVRAQWVTQSFDLKPGWNAVFLTLEPVPADCDDIFSSNPDIDSVWQWSRHFTTADYTLDPAQLMPEDSHWRVWYPQSSEYRFITSLHSLSGNSGYLVHLRDGAAPDVLTLTGRALELRLACYPRSLSMVTFPSNPDNPPTVTRMLRTHPEIDTNAGSENDIYSIDASARARRILLPSQVDLQAGNAYWVETQDSPDVIAPLTLANGTIHFGAVKRKHDLVLYNRDTEPMTVRFDQVPSALPPSGQPELAGPVLLAIETFNEASNRWEWIDWPQGVSREITIPSGDTYDFVLGVRRIDLPDYTPLSTNGALYQSVLRITADQAQIRYDLPVTAASGNDIQLPPSIAAQAGLWIGEAIVAGVSGPDAADLTPLQAQGRARLRVIIHVDSAGQSVLLQQVLLAHVPVGDTDESEVRLYADHTLLPSDAFNVQRISNATLPFSDGFPLTGHFTNQLETVVALSSDAPTNPYRHPFHPDHDNLDPEGDPLVHPEARSVVRSILFEMDQASAPDWQYGDRVQGYYRETIIGLKAVPIHVAGSFVLTRISTISEID